MRRLYPVPFRMIKNSQQFKKWQWITVRIEKASKDHRPESHKVFVDTIQCGTEVTTKAAWADRWQWLDKMPIFSNFDSIELAEKSDGLSLAVMQPKEIIGLDIDKARNSDWTEEERAKLLKEQLQGNLFSEEEERHEVRQLRKIPFDFYYRYTYDSDEGVKTARHKITDWEAGALYWNCRRSHGSRWEQPFREKLESKLLNTNLMFLMGNQHRFRDQWLIISLIYPPKPKPVEDRQHALF